VDDSRTTRLILVRALRALEFEVVEADHGEHALEVLGTVAPVDLVCTDLHMPRLDGTSLIRALRADPRYRAVPILVASASAAASDLRPARDAGATGHLRKPFTPETIARRLSAMGLLLARRAA
jgi:two-component system chemotaxis response regulator CheY